MRREHSAIFLLLTLIVLTTAPANIIYAQTVFKENKTGHIYSISVPDYMTKTTGLNASASVQYQCLIKDAGVIVIDESKESLAMAGLKFSSIEEYFDYIIKTFLSDQTDKKISKAKTFKVGEINFVQVEASSYDAKAKMHFYYLKTIAETPDYYYQILAWTDEGSKDKLKDDLMKIPLSLKEVTCQ